MAARATGPQRESDASSSPDTAARASAVRRAAATQRMRVQLRRPDRGSPTARTSCCCSSPGAIPSRTSRGRTSPTACWSADRAHDRAPRSRRDRLVRRPRRRPERPARRLGARRAARPRRRCSPARSRSRGGRWTPSTRRTSESSATPPTRYHRIDIRRHVSAPGRPQRRRDDRRHDEAAGALRVRVRARAGTSPATTSTSRG